MAYLTFHTQLGTFGPSSGEENGGFPLSPSCFFYPLPFFDFAFRICMRTHVTYVHG